MMMPPLGRLMSRSAKQIAAALLNHDRAVHVRIIGNCSSAAVFIAQHLKRYLAEFDFRYNERAALGVSDAARAGQLVHGIVGKRLTNRNSSQ